MNKSDKPYQKLSFIASQMRLRYEVNKAFTLKHPTPPQEILDQVVKKLQQEKAQGKIKFIRIFNTRLDKIWKALRDSQDHRDHVAVTLGAGAPDFPGVDVKEYKGTSKIAFYLSIDAAQEDIEAWDPMQLKLYIGHILRSKNISHVPNAAHIYSLWLRAAHGQKINQYPVRCLPEFPMSGDSKKARKPFHIIQTDDSGDLSIALFDASNSANIHFCETVINSLKQKVSEIEEVAGVTYEIFVEHIISKFHSANRGPEHLGIDLPFMVHAASISEQVNSGKCKKTFGNTSSSKDDLKKKQFSFNPLKIEINEEGSKAVIKNFDPSHYYQKNQSITLSWIDEQLEKNGVRFGFSEDIYNQADLMIRAHRSFENFVIAEGEKPAPGKNPKIELVQLKSKEGILNKAYANAGDCIAKVVYDEPPKFGTDIYGNSLPPKEEALEFSFDHNLIERVEDKFFAKENGSPVIDGQHLTIRKVLIFNKGIESTQDNIYFDGDIEVNGDISFNKVIHCTGKLTVNGSINGGRIFCKGEVEVTDGIIGKTIRIHSPSDVKAEFVDNVNQINCKNLITNKHIAHTTVFAKESIQVLNEDGNLFGGTYTCEGDIISPNIGRDNAKTRLFAGYLVHNKLRRALYEGRKSKLYKEHEKTKTRLSSAKSKPKKDPKELQLLEERLEQISRILDSVEHLLKKVQSRTANPKAKIKVAKILSREVQVWVAQVKISRQTDLEGAVLIGPSSTNRHILSFKDAS